tara:strand:- start:661 stop:1536 length:876 start_codon:yes stop_codon:yes gene_type:complete
MKPTFLLGAGVGWAATNPLRHTLREVCNVGRIREHHYLNLLCGQGTKKAMINHCIKWEKRNKIYEAQPVIDWLRQPVSFESYLSYYKKLYDATDISMVGDVSNSNYELPEEFLIEALARIKEHYNVKAYMIFRDPVRRTWSHMNHRYFDNNDVRNRLRRGNTTFYDFLNAEILNDWSTTYIQNLEKYQRHVDTLPIVMEELWEGDSDAELELISTHIGARVDTLYDNNYSPDRGINFKRTNRKVRDQWSDRLELTSEVYYQIKQILQPTYDAWIDKFGSLPLYWGTPLTYQ